MMQKIKLQYDKIILFALMILPTLIISWNLDNDFWFLVNQGEYIVNNGFPIIEPFTIHEGFSFIIQQWLFDVIIYYIYSLFGSIGIILFVHLAGLSLLFFTYKLCMLLSENKMCLSSLLTTLIYFFMCMWFMVSRPQIITYNIIIIELICLEKYSRSSKWLYLIPLPILSLLQINIHSSMWWMLIVFLLPYVAETIKIKFKNINVETIRRTPLLIIFVITLIIGLVNPYGLKAITYLFNSYGVSTINELISEMLPPDIKTFYGVIYYIILGFIAVCYILNKTGKTKLRYVLLTAGTIYLALSSIKSISYFLIGSVIPLAFFLKNKGDKLIIDLNKKSLNNIVIIFLAVIFVFGNCIKITDYKKSKDYPPTYEAIQYVAQNNDTDEVVMYSGYNDGGYVEYLGMKTYMDARAEVFLKSNNKKEDIFDEYVKLQDGELYYKNFLNKYNFTHLLVVKEDLLYEYLANDENYTIYYEDTNCKVYKLR